MQYLKHHLPSFTFLLVILVIMLPTVSAFGQDPPPLEDPPGSAYGWDTQFTVTLDDVVNFTITSADTIDAAIHAFSSQSLEMALQGGTGVESTQMTISGLPPGAELYKSEDDLRNVTVINVDYLGTYSWVQDLSSPHSVLIKPEPSTWYLDDTGWTAKGDLVQTDHTYSAWYRLDDPPGDDIASPDRYFILETFGAGPSNSASYCMRSEDGPTLEALYSFDGNANDLSANLNHPLTINSINYVAGFEGQAADFNGVSSYIDIPVNIGPSSYPEITFGAWVKTRATSGRRAILSNDNCCYDRQIGLDDRWGEGWGWTAFSGNGAIDGVNSGSVVADEWTFVAVSYRPGSTTLFVDDQVYHLAMNNTDDGTSYSRIGKNPNYDSYFDGLIDNLFIISGPMTDEQVQSIGQNGVMSLDSQLADFGSVNTYTENHQAPSATITDACGTQWHNILVTYDADAAGAEHSIYLDGAFVTNMASSSMLHETLGLMIGTNGDHNGHFFNGWIDDVAFWKRVVTADEIAAIQLDAVGDIGGLEDDLVAYWNFDDDFLATHGGTAFDGTPVNEPTIEANGRFDRSVRFQRANSQWVQVDSPVVFREFLNPHIPGTWQTNTDGSKTAVLTEDVYETIQITGTNITLDGGGFRVDAYGYGVKIAGGSGVTIRNVEVTSSNYGIYLSDYYSSGCTVQNATVTGGYYGINVFGGTSHTIENTRVRGGSYGIYVRVSSQLTIFSNPEIGHLLGSTSGGGVYIDGSPDARVEGNTINSGSLSRYAIFLSSVRRALIAGNVCTGEAGMRLDGRGGARDCVIRDNSVAINGNALYLGARLSGNEIMNNTFVSHSSYALHMSRTCLGTLYNNNFISESELAPYVGSFYQDMTFNLLAPVGGNYWNTWTGPDADGDGFIDLPYDLGSGQADNLPYTRQDGWLITTVAVTGTVSSNCDGPLAGVTVNLQGADGEPLSAVTEEDGSYAFEELIAEIDYEVTVIHPAGYGLVAPGTATIILESLAADATVDFALGCPVDVTGTVFSDCGVPMAGVTVGLDILPVDPESLGDYFPVATDSAGVFLFEDVSYGSEAELTCVLPLGFHAADPIDGHTGLTLTQDTTLDFALDCVATTGSARGMGYWKHQANVFIKGRGKAHETQEDMETNFPAAIFDHFHENGLNAIAVEGVTYMEGNEHAPLDLATIQSTLTVRGGQNMPARAKQHYLALLLNLASGKIMTFTEASEDGRTASEALQYVALLINDGDPANDELAKDISEAMNEARMLDAGMIPEDFTYIAYRPGMGGVPRSVELSQNAPNPFNPMTKIAFALPSEQRVQIGIFAINGRRVATLLDEVVSQGRHEVVWTGQDDRGRSVASGTYFYRLDASQFSETKRMVLVK